MTNYSFEQLEKLLKNLPQGLQETILSNEINDSIYEVLENNQILDQRAGQISDLIRNVLFGLLPPEDFKESLKKEVGLKDDIAKKIFQEINRFVFFPVKQSLASLYKVEAATEEEKPESAQEEIPVPEKPAKSDSYLEQIE